MTASTEDSRETLDTLENQGAELATALEFFDALPPITVEQMIGNWGGAGIDTGNPLDGLLETMHWHGKRYESADNAHPLVMDGKDGQFSLNPTFVPMGLAIKFSSLLDKAAVQKAVLPLLQMLKTRKPAARLRMVEYRGVVSGTMIYDTLPINDHFRLVDDNTLIGAMDLRGMDNPFIFTLHRESDGGVR